MLEAVGAIARAAAAGAGRGRDRRDREPAVGHAIKPGDIVRAKQRHHDRGQQHRRRGPARAGRLPRARDRPRRRAAGRPGDADRRDRGRARRRLRGPVRQRRRVGGEVAAAGERTGELVWRLPLHAEYAKAIEGRYGDIVNSTEDARRRRSPRPSSCTASPATSRGRTSTSPARRTTAGAPTRPRAARAGACGCWSSSHARNRARPTCTEGIKLPKGV